MSPTQRSLRHLRNQGYTAEVVERWNPFSRTRKDLFGWMDLLAYNPRGTVGVQTTTRTNFASRKRKMLANLLVRTWCAAGNAAILHGWAKRKIRGKKRVFYELTEERW